MYLLVTCFWLYKIHSQFEFSAQSLIFHPYKGTSSNDSNSNKESNLDGVTYYYLGSAHSCVTNIDINADWRERYNDSLSNSITVVAMAGVYSM